VTGDKHRDHESGPDLRRDDPLPEPGPQTGDTPADTIAIARSSARMHAGFVKGLSQARAIGR
jgi:hypothetical protein